MNQVPPMDAFAGRPDQAAAHDWLAPRRRGRGRAHRRRHARPGAAAAAPARHRARPFRRHRFQRLRRARRARASGRRRCSPCSCRSAIPIPTACASASMLADTPRHRDGDGGHRADPGRRRLLPRAATTSSAASCRNSAPAGAARSCSRERAAYNITAARGGIAGGRAANAAHAARHLSRRRRRDQHEAAHAQAARILSRRPAELRRARHAQPARIRPGLLREERRRRRRHQADRASLQDAGLCSSPRISACPRRSARARRRPTPGRSRRAQEEFYFSLPYAGWTSASTGWSTASRRRKWRARAGLTPDQVEAVWRDIAAKRARHRATCTSPRCWWSRCWSGEPHAFRNIRPRARLFLIGSPACSLASRWVFRDVP